MNNREILCQSHFDYRKQWDRCLHILHIYKRVFINKKGFKGISECYPISLSAVIKRAQTWLYLIAVNSISLRGPVVK